MCHCNGVCVCLLVDLTAVTSVSLALQLPSLKSLSLWIGNRLLYIEFFPPLQFIMHLRVGIGSLPREWPIAIKGSE